MTFASVLSFGLLTGCATARSDAPPLAGVAPAPDIDLERGASLSQIVARADSAWSAASYPLALRLYQLAVARDSMASRAVFRLATLHGWNSDLSRAQRLFRHYIALEPRDVEGRLALARALAWDSQYSTAIAMYDTVLGADRSYRDAVVGRAQTLTWAGRTDEGLMAYQQWTATHPADHDALIEYARALSWSGRLDEATAIYAPLAASGDVDAQKGLARVAAWRGAYVNSVDAWERVIVLRPNDAEALTGLAQVLHWMERDTEASAVLRRALVANPGYGDARVLMRVVDAAVRPTVTFGTSSTDDSDQNRVTNLLLGYESPNGPRKRAGVSYVGRSARLATTTSRVDALGTFVRWQPGTWWFRADGGVSRHSSTLMGPSVKPGVLGNAAVHASGVVARVVTLDLTAARAPFDETALLIANGVVISEYAADADVALPARFALRGTASRARLTGGTKNNGRDAFASNLRWNYNRHWNVGIGTRQFGYDSAATDGYFSPRKYRLTEVTGRGRVGADLGWNADVDIGVGRQSIDFFAFSVGSRLAQRVALSAGYRFDPARDITLTGRYGNVAAPGQTGGSEYRIHAIALTVRLGL